MGRFQERLEAANRKEIMKVSKAEIQGNAPKSLVLTYDGEKVELMEDQAKQLYERLTKGVRHAKQLSSKEIQIDMYFIKHILIVKYLDAYKLVRAFDRCFTEGVNSLEYGEAVTAGTMTII